MADTEEVVFEFMVPGRAPEVVDHAGRLPGPQPGQFSIPLVGRAVGRHHP
jgi:hypothetical protein